MSGKLADTVMSVRNGEQLARKYQPVVFNPSTPAQVAQRAKLKLLSQLSAVVAPVIAIPREGSVSSRNLFTKHNFPLVTYAGNTASVTLNNIQLTKSVVAMPAITASRDSESGMVNAALSYAVSGLSRVVYCFFLKSGGDSLSLLNTEVVENASTAPSTFASTPFGTTFTSEIVVLAYGVRDNTESARAVFGDMQVVNAETVAKVVVNRTLTEADITLTKTEGTTIS